ncbi:MAG: hypothetical protein GWP61_02095 [Chloroflexi bacterium]|jgi:hypothetical protein|nr:hypothetical protein [Chloroflexota bacterium]
MRLIRLFHFLLGLSLVATLLVACGGQGNESYNETFDQDGDWSSGDDTHTEGQIIDGVYDLLIKGDDVSRWASAGKNFGDGVYTVEATQIEGPLDNGYGMLLRADTERGDFYLFKISGDGYAWIGRYRDEAEEQSIIGDHWFESAAVKQGLNQTNQLRVEAESGNMIFYVNGQEVGRVTDKTFQSGDIGLFAQSLGFGGVHIQFDNYAVTPLDR